MVLPLTQFAPTDGSPASPPMLLGAGWSAKLSGSVPAAGGQEPSSALRVALAV